MVFIDRSDRFSYSKLWARVPDKLCVRVSLSQSAGEIGVPYLSIPGSPAGSSYYRLVSFIQMSGRADLPMLCAGGVPLLRSAVSMVSPSNG